MQNISFKNAYTHSFQFALFVEPVDWVGGSVSLQRLTWRAYNLHADKAVVSPAATIADYATIVVLCELGIIGHQHKKLTECLPCKL